MTRPDATSTAFARSCIAAGSLLMLAGLVLGAVGTHVVADRVGPRELASYETAVLYQLLHALGLVLVGTLARPAVTMPLRWSAGLMGLGIACFSGSIYLATAGLPHWVLDVAPAGGLSFMASWLMLALHALVHGRG